MLGARRAIFILCGLAVGPWLGTGPLAAADRVLLRADVTDKRCFQVNYHLNAAGKIITRGLKDKVETRQLNVDGKFTFAERRLPGLGRDAKALRSVREFSRAQAEVQVGEQVTYSRLKDGHQLIVARGQREGVESYSPLGPLSYSEIELLQLPGDPLAVLALLPDDAVEVGSTWRPADWVLQVLTAMEAAESVTLQCRLAEITGGQAKVAIKGEITGADLGAGAKVSLEGFLLFDLEGKYVRHVELTQTERRASGVVTPELEVLAKSTVDREPGNCPANLSDQACEQWTADVDASALMVWFESPEWGVRLLHDRNWHLFHQNSKVLILRLLDRGNMIAQLDLHPIPAAEPGSHVPENTFVSDVQKALGKNLKKLVDASRVEAGKGRYLFRVMGAGDVPSESATHPAPTEFLWTYYLLAHGDGRQVVLTATIEPKFVEAVRHRDLSIAESIEFVAPRKAKAAPTPATEPKPAPGPR